ncbi:MAG: NifU family protein [Bdellovibrionales bacterium]|nr:NifU family protein [Bdellovibrionales bacterium]
MTTQIPIAPDDILIRAQDTPNPFAIKFIINFALKSNGNATFTTKEQCASLPLAAALFDIPGVEQIYFFQNTLTVTHTDELPADMIKENVKAILKTRLTVHDPDFESPDEAKSKEKPDRSNMTPERVEIEEILDRTIRPGLQSDGGDIEVVEFANNEVKIIYQGACGGCPSSMMGTLDAIQSILRNELNNEQITVTPL